MAETEEVKSPTSNKRPLSDVEHENGMFLNVPRVPSCNSCELDTDCV